MRVRIIASKPRFDGDEVIAPLIGREFNVIREVQEGVMIDVVPTGMLTYPDEYEVVEQKEAPESSTL